MPSWILLSLSALLFSSLAVRRLWAGRWIVFGLINCAAVLAAQLFMHQEEFSSSARHAVQASLVFSSIALYRRTENRR